MKSLLQTTLEKQDIKTMEFMDYTPGHPTCLGVEVVHNRGTTIGRVMATLALSDVPVKTMESSQLYNLDIEVTGDSNVIGILYFPGEDYTE